MINYETYCKIKDYRERQHLTITQTARALGLNAQTVTKWVQCAYFRARKPIPRSSRLDPFRNRVVSLLNAYLHVQLADDRVLRTRVFYADAFCSLPPWMRC